MEDPEAMPRGYSSLVSLVVCRHEREQIRAHAGSVYDIVELQFHLDVVLAEYCNRDCSDTSSNRCSFCRLDDHRFVELVERSKEISVGREVVVAWGLPQSPLSPS